MEEQNNKRNEINFSAKTDVGIHRKLAEEEGLTIKELHEKITAEKSIQIIAEIRKEKGIELLPREELKLMINELSSMEKGVSNMETSQLLTLIHQGFGKLPSLAAATLLKVKKDASYEIIKKLRNLLKETDEDNQGSDSSTDSTDFPQLKNPELDQIVQSLQDIVKNPSGIEEEIGNSEVSNLERPEPISNGSDDKKEETVKQT